MLLDWLAWLSLLRRTTTSAALGTSVLVLGDVLHPFSAALGTSVLVPGDVLHPFVLVVRISVLAPGDLGDVPHPFSLVFEG